MLSRLRAEAIRPSFVSTALAESLAQAMLIEWSHAVCIPQYEDASRGGLLPRHLRIIDEYLEGLCGESPSVSAIAQACGFSERYFAQLFKRHTQQSIGAYLKSMQIEKAKSLLMGSDLPLKAIAFHLGFKTPSNFFVAFRAATGQTPATFRRINHH
jgi:AraC-like DNA-binding protein